MRVRLAELVGTLSLASDTGTGVPEEAGLRSAATAVRLGELSGASEAERRDAFYLTLLRYTGCTSGADIVARVMGDEIEFIEDAHSVDFGRMAEMLPLLLGRAFRSKDSFLGLSAVGRLLSALPSMPEVGREHCETAVLIARRFGFSEPFQRMVHQGFERWDGTGQPTRARGEEIGRAMRFAQLAIDAYRGYQLGGIEAAVAFTKKHSGRELDPALVETFGKHARELEPTLGAASGWEAAMAAEPGAPSFLDDAGVDEALGALGDFADLKSRYTRGHCRGVAELAKSAARSLGLGDEAERELFRAGLVHDIGRVAVSVLVWDKAGPFADSDRERVRLHAYAGERILARSQSLAGVAAIATLAHERPDGTGYHRRLAGAQCPSAGHVLAAADAYQALLSDRAHRKARSRVDAGAELRRLVATGALTSEAVDAVLGAKPRSTLDAPSPLTERELEVLALVAKGLTNKEIGRALDISPKTAGRHLEHVFEKLGVTTRAGATMVALQRGLVR
jgi:HD-GYP domain-containing protein (c-di-GMP phosphodiesterase class II)/DNA-binding CsgD family transcriptional regulator